MGITTIIIFCCLLLVSYIFDLTASRTKIPSVIFLLLCGWAVKKAIVWLNIDLPDLYPALPVLGTVGLVLIVLEGSLELDLSRSKLELVRKSFLSALVALCVTALLLALALNYIGGAGFLSALINAVPLTVISSAIAIPSARRLIFPHREFIVYESIFSDILGVFFFNFLLLSTTIDKNLLGYLSIQIVLIAAISLVSIVSLSLLLGRIEYHVKFIPIILLVVLIYAITKVYHLPGLTFILLFGLSLSNISKFRKIPWMARFNLSDIEREVNRFKNMTTEFTFLVRSLFFLLFGYYIETDDVLNVDTSLWAAAIVLLIFSVRAIQLWLFRLPLLPLLFISPRGLITILLFISIEPPYTISLINKSLITQVIVLTSLIMAIELIISRERNVGAGRFA
jgi:Kef-type K+ transport system membrane component KefB